MIKQAPGPTKSRGVPDWSRFLHFIGDGRLSFSAGEQGIHSSPHDRNKCTLPYLE